MHVRIAGVGHFTPSLVLTNSQLVERYGLSVDADWIEAKTGIVERHWMPEGQTTSDMAAEAGRRILEKTGTDPAEIDLLILATASPDHPSPPSAPTVARKLGIRCTAFDLAATCSGFLFGLEVGANAVRCGRQKVLVIAADARSRWVDPNNRRSLVLFADAAAGALLVPSAEPGFLAIETGSEGDDHFGAWVPAGGAAMPTSAETVAKGLHYVQVDGKRDIFDGFVKYTREICDRVLASAGLQMAEIDLFITHQGNARMVERVLDELNIPPERAMNSIARHGNVSAATVPLALSEALEAGRIEPGDRVLLTSAGAGFTFGAAVHRFATVPS